jgi:hypothetical protein
MRAAEGIIPASFNSFSDPSHIKPKMAKGSRSGRGGFKRRVFLLRPCRRPATGRMAGINKQSERYEGFVAATITLGACSDAPSVRVLNFCRLKTRAALTDKILLHKDWRSHRPQGCHGLQCDREQHGAGVTAMATQNSQRRFTAA